MKIPRNPGKEGKQDREASRAYNRTSRWPIFAFERYLVFRALARSTLQGTILDIGCGPGFLAAGIRRRYPALRTIGLDNNAEMVQLATQNRLIEKDVGLLRGDAQQLPLTQNSIDFIVSSLSLHHWPEAKTAFEEMKRILKPGGQFVIFDLRRNSPHLFYWALKLAQAISPKAIRRTNGAVGSFWASYTPEEIERLLKDTGWKIPTIERHFGWMLISGRKD
jgi:ubiquinone/menaquinone biosynthesis C-methylase UbiE